MRQVTQLAGAIFTAGLLLATSLTAQPQEPGDLDVDLQLEVNVRELACLPRAEMSVLYATIDPPAEAVVLYAFFRQEELEDYYYKTMHRESPDTFWAILPRPEHDNPSVEYYVTAEDLAGNVLGQSYLHVSPVLPEDECPVVFTPDQEEVRNRLRVGETTEEQEGETVWGFMCPGIIERIDVEGEVRRDEICDPLIAWWTKREFLLGAGITGLGISGVIIIDDRDPEEVSPFAPRPSPFPAESFRERSAGDGQPVRQPD